ncbi:MAG TPA: type II secretion system F family protein [Alphaproteobacteria bacterium]|nr:type II secretion system F family protein [Alphaproteobacteria bacterium]
MPIYNYISVEPSGKERRGKMNANNPLDLEARLREIKLELVDYKTVSAERKQGVRSKLKPKELVMFCVHMEELEKAGVPILDSLIDLRDSAENPHFKDLLTDLCEFLKGGDQLSAALKKRSDVFDELFVSLISAGEETGNIGNAFGHLSRHIKWSNDFKRKIKKAISYPIVLVVVMISVVTLMMLFVVPQLTDFLQKQGFDLPLHTRALIATSNFFAEYWWTVVFGIPAAFVAFILLYRRNEAFRYKIDKYVLKFPGIGSVILKINLARFIKFFSITFNSGLGVLESLAISRKVVTNRTLREAVDHSITNISNGTRLAEAIKETDAFPSLVIRMIKVGEDSGNMESALSNVNFFYEREIDDSVEAMVAMIQPALLLVLGGILTWVIAAVFGPIYASFSKMKF